MRVSLTLVRRQWSVVNLTLVESTTDIRRDGGFLPWRRSGENLPTRGGWRKEERLPPSHARGGDALPPSREEEDSFLEPSAEQGSLHVAGADTSS